MRKRICLAGVGPQPILTHFLLFADQYSTLTAQYFGETRHFAVISSGDHSAALFPNVSLANAILNRPSGDGAKARCGRYSDAAERPILERPFENIGDKRKWLAVVTTQQGEWFVANNARSKLTRAALYCLQLTQRRFEVILPS
jgi:hypothetical protein